MAATKSLRLVSVQIWGGEVIHLGKRRPTPNPSRAWEGLYKVGAVGGHPQSPGRRFRLHPLYTPNLSTYTGIGATPNVLRPSLCEVT